MQQQSYTISEGDFSVADGLSIFYRDYQPTKDTALVPVVYLPGLMRTARDFDRVASRLAAERRVITIDTRGRGRGAHSDDPAAYEMDKLVNDVWELTDHLGVQRFVVVGLALGVFMSWLMASTKPERIAGIIANDTGTETNNALGKKMVSLADQGEYSFDEAVEKLRETNQKNFRDFGIDDWRAYTRLVYAQTSTGKWKRDFHPAILAAWAKVKETKPSFWEEFSSIGNIPVTVLRGADSQFLTQEQAQKMAAALLRGRTYNIQGRAHPLLLDEPASLIAIREVLAEADANS